MLYIENKNAETVYVSKGNNPRILYRHQIDAMSCMNREDEKATFNSLLVLPTGAGKTLTAVYWLLKNAINQNKKVLWIAHRHLLLEQAAESFISNSYSDLLPQRLSYKYRIVSGIHDRPIHIKKDDDVVIAGKDSINKRLESIGEWMKDEDIYLVIDEAHHAVSKSYRKIINYVKEQAAANHTSVKMLGLTATPYRTDESEKALLGELFTDDIVYSISLDELIKKGILSTPVFKHYNTNFSAGEKISPEMIKAISFSDNLPEDLAKQMAENKDRNHLIVSKYLENKETFKKTIVFALNINHAIQLNALFEKNNIKSDYVVSNLRDMILGISRSREENEAAIKAFKGEVEDKSEETDVLINVNILTEGTDLPQTQTVFLTRPTLSKVLMTQMVGRALRGELAGGTKDAYIVSFIDEWEDKISFESPESIIVEGPTPQGRDYEYEKKEMRMISISLIEEFARILDETVDTSKLENLPFSERVPLGMYMITYQDTDSKSESSIEKNHSVIVYNNSKDNYELFFKELGQIMDKYEVTDEIIDESKINPMVSYCKEKYFADVDIPPCKDIDIEAILKYHAQNGLIPTFIPMSELNRSKVNLSYIAQDIIDLELPDIKKKDYLIERWNDDSTLLKLYYTDFEYFKRQLDKEIDKIIYGQEESPEPLTESEKRELEKCTLQEIIGRDPSYGIKLKENVFNAALEDGAYRCERCGMTSKNRKDFQVDHIIPMSKGGLTTPDNLRLLCRRCNMILSDHSDDIPLASSELSEDVMPNISWKGLAIKVELGNEKREFTVTPDRKKRGYMTFTIGNNKYKLNLKNKKLERL